MYIFLHILFRYGSKDGSKAPIQLWGRGRSCHAYARSRMFGLGIAPKERLSRLFNLVSIQE